MTAEIRSADASMPYELLEMAADLAHAHAARIHRDNLVVEVGKSPLILRGQLLGSNVRLGRAGSTASSSTYLSRTRGFFRMARCDDWRRLEPGQPPIEVLVQFGIKIPTAKMPTDHQDHHPSKTSVRITTGKQLTNNSDTYRHTHKHNNPTTTGQQPQKGRGRRKERGRKEEERERRKEERERKKEKREREREKEKKKKKKRKKERMVFF